MKYKRIIVTGGAGFIGSHVLEACAGRGSAVALMDDFNDYYAPSIKRENARKTGAKVFEGDLRDRDWCMDVVRDFAPDAIIHLAARAGVRPSLEAPQLYMATNLNGTLNLLDGARDCGVAAFVFASSSSVYGNNPKTPFSEEDPLVSIISPYAVSKHAGEQLCRIYAQQYKMGISALRFFTVYGPRQRPDLAISTFVRRIHEGLPITLFGDGSSSRDYTYVSDIVSGVIAALENVRPGFDVFNIGGEAPVSLRRLVEVVEQVVGKPATIDWKPPQPGDVDRTWADLSKAKRVLGYSPKTSLPSGVDAFYKWWLATAR